MEQEYLNFGEFLAAEMRDKGISLKKLSEVTGIAPIHLENMLRGDFENVPSSPYFHGYLLHIGKVFGFDGEEWWKRIKKENVVRNSGPADALPQNRFIKKVVPKSYWIAGIAGVLIVIYLAVTLPHILGKPSLTINYPAGNPVTATATTITFQGTVRNADALYLSNGNASSSESIVVAPDGSWEKSVLLQNGLNTFEFSAKKFLGGETDITEQVIYELSPPATSSASSSAVFPTVHFPSGTPATGSYFQ